MITESDVYARLARHVPACYTRIENVIGRGTFDVNGICYGQERWIEIKIIKNNSFEYRSSQVVWGHTRICNGARNLFILCGYEKGDDVLLLPAEPSIKLCTLNETNIVNMNTLAWAYPRTPIKMGWESIKEYLFTQEALNYEY